MGVGGTVVGVGVSIGSEVGVAAGISVGPRVGLSSGVGVAVSVGTCEGLGVLVGVGVTEGEGAKSDDSGHVQLMVIIAANAASTRANLRIIEHPDPRSSPCLSTALSAD